MNLSKTIFQAGNSAKSQAIKQAQQIARQAAYVEPKKIIETAGVQLMGTAPSEPREVNAPNMDQEKMQDKKYREEKYSSLKSQLDEEISKAHQKRLEEEKRISEVNINNQAEKDQQKAVEAKKKEGIFGKIKSRLQSVKQKVGKREKKQGPSG